MESPEKKSLLISGEKQSNRYYARKMHMKNKTIPTITEIKNSVNSLESILKCQLPYDTRKIIGYEPKITGPREPLWVPPNSDISIEKKLFPVPMDYVKALTHNGIMDIGDKAFKHTEERYEKNLKNVIIENDALWKWIVTNECEKSVKQAVKKERLLQENDIDNIIAEYSKIHDAIVKVIESQYNIKLIEKADESNKELTEVLSEEKENALHQQKQNLSIEFEKKLDTEKEKLTQLFEDLSEQQHARFYQELRECSQTLRHQLECRGLADVLYTACSERHYYLMKQSRAEKYFQTKYNELAVQLTTCEQQLQDTKLKYEDTTQNEQKLKEHIKILCKMMRKFMAYQFNVPPSQLGFLPIFESIYIDNKIDEETTSLNNKNDQSVGEAKIQENINTDEGFIFWKSSEKQSQPEKEPFLVYGDLAESAMFSKNIYGSPASSEGLIPELERSESQLSITSSKTMQESKIEVYEDTEFSESLEVSEKLFKIELDTSSQKSTQLLLNIHQDSVTLANGKRIVAESDIADVGELSISKSILGFGLPLYMTRIGVDDVQRTYEYYKEASKCSLNSNEGEKLSELDLKIPSFNFTSKLIEKKVRSVECEKCQCHLQLQNCQNISADAGKVRKDSDSKDSLPKQDFFKVVAEDESWKHLEKSPEQFTKYTQETLEQTFKTNPSLIQFFKEKRIM